MPDPFMILRTSQPVEYFVSESSSARKDVLRLGDPDDFGSQPKRCTRTVHSKEPDYSIHCLSSDSFSKSQTSVFMTRAPRIINATCKVESNAETIWRTEINHWSSPDIQPI